jgi:hypothetical protein
MTAAISTSYTEEEKVRIQLQLDRVLGNVHFSNSRRFPSFLRFIVQEELEGRGDQLKERTLGVEVFGRDASYDTTSDPIVRVTAAEIRKRIAQYYQESGHADEIRISLPPGSYIPHFDKPHADVSPASPIPVLLNSPPSPAMPATYAPSLAAARGTKFSRSRIVAACAVLLLILTGAVIYQRSRPTALDLFWAPILNTSGDPVIVCFPQSHISGIVLRDANDPSQQHQMQ